MYENRNDESQFISQHNEKVDTDSLTMITGNIPEKSTDNEQISMSIPMNTPIFQDMSPTNPVVEHQEQAHIQVQEH